MIKLIKKMTAKASILVLSLIFLTSGAALLWFITLDIPDFYSFAERVVAESTKIYDRTGQIVLYDVSAEIKRRIVPFEEISKHAKNATVAIEDAEFYGHRGIKPQAILRAFLINLGSGSIRQGGSTITQQLVKNALLTRERSIARKLKEAVLSLKVEAALSKEEILTLYLNEVPYGGNIYGIEEASQTFFQKAAGELNLAEAAYLAAIPKAPTFYSPYGPNRERLEERKNLVLQRMMELKFATAEEVEQARTQPVTFAPPDPQGIKAPHFVMMVLSYLEETYGREVVQTKGLKVITTLDLKLQQKAEEIVQRYAEDNSLNFNAYNAAAVALHPQTGEVVALVGSKNFFGKPEPEGCSPGIDCLFDPQVNIAVHRPGRQPGSAFKPFAYAAAFEKGYTPETALFDLPTQFDTACLEDPERCYTPQNYDGKFRGPVTFREALAQSINIPSIKVLYLAGIKETISLAQQAGITTLVSPDRYGLTLVLGGGEVTLLELTSAYGAFAADGLYTPPRIILKVEDRQSRILEEALPAPRRVLGENTARLIADILSDNRAREALFGPTSPLFFKDRQVAVKTGTTNDYRDAWMVGFTPQIIAGAWAGNSNNVSMEKKIAGFIVATMWRAFMEEALSDLPAEPFPRPEKTPEDLKPTLRGSWLGGRNYFIDKISQKLATEYTPPDLIEEKVLKEVHSILFWVDKNDPRGDSPENPARDPQFNLWESAVRRWTLVQNIVEETTEALPRDHDDIHLPEYRPTLRVVSPEPGSVFRPEDKIVVRVEYQSHFPISQLDVFLNDTYLNSVKEPPFELAFIPAEVYPIQSENKLRVAVYDSVKNRGETSIIFRLFAPVAGSGPDATPTP